MPTVEIIEINIDDLEINEEEFKDRATDERGNDD